MDMKQIVGSATSLQEAITELYGVSLSTRAVLQAEAMEGKTAAEYDTLGRTNRSQTYQRIVEDFKRRTGCYGINHPERMTNVGTIIDVGCGSGLLSLELAERTNGKIIGIDLSADMLTLAEKNREQREEERKKRRALFLQKQRVDVDTEKNDALFSLQERVTFRLGSVYDLPDLLQGTGEVNYIVCRNALHRLHEPEKAIQKMYESLSGKGKLYLRDLRRDAEWNIIRERIGEARWESETLVDDYIKAMAGMLTVEELKGLVDSVGIRKYRITEGNYNLEDSERVHSFQEYERQVEYVCIIEKS